MKEVILVLHPFLSKELAQLRIEELQREASSDHRRRRVRVRVARRDRDRGIVARLGVARSAETGR